MKVLKAITLDKYYVNCTDHMEQQEIEGKRIYIAEIEGSLDKDDNLKNMTEMSKLIGKRVFNYEEAGYIKLGIEPK